MDAWGVYQSRMEASGTTKRESIMNRERRFLESKTQDNLSFFSVLINGVSQDVSIINTDNLDEKFIHSLPGESIAHGGTVEWMGNHWLITERDANNELYTRAKMIQCNYLLRWIDSDSIIREQWCIIEDGTKYLTGQYEDRSFVVTRGDSRLGMTIAKNEHTEKMKRGFRFLIDDPKSETLLAYELTKPFKLSGVYNEQGVFKFVLQEVNSTDDDNQALRVADYYKHYPKLSGETSAGNVINPDNTTADGRQVWL